MAVVAGMKKTNDHEETTKVNAKKKKNQDYVPKLETQTITILVLWFEKSRD